MRNTSGEPFKANYPIDVDDGWMAVWDQESVLQDEQRPDD